MGSIHDGPHCQQRQVACQTDYADSAITDSLLSLERLEATVVSQKLLIESCVARLAALDEKLSEIMGRLVLFPDILNKCIEFNSFCSNAALVIRKHSVNDHLTGV